jgi:hypothetical protein
MGLRSYLMVLFLCGLTAQAQSTVALPKGVTGYGVGLTWNAPVNSANLPTCTTQLIAASDPCWDPVAGYNVYRSPTGGLLNATPVTLVAYTDSTVVEGNTYTYYVESVDASGATSVPSNTVTVPIPATLFVPTPPVIGTLHAT